MVYAFAEVGRAIRQVRERQNVAMQDLTPELFSIYGSSLQDISIVVLI